MSNKEPEYPTAAERRRQQAKWSGKKIRALREHLEMTQIQMAEELQVRQQTISEWEVGMHTPHRSTQKVLSMVAEKAGFTYSVEREQDDDDGTKRRKRRKSSKETQSEEQPEAQQVQSDNENAEG